MSAEGARQLRSGCLRLIAEALRRFPDTIDYGFLWPRLFGATEPLIARIPTEVSLQNSCMSAECMVFWA